eukprot:m.9721 g.9721  ORF g.9721 m.9721 type:complete len:208 (+) comp4120_c0_seq2:242-865(+)
MGRKNKKAASQDGGSGGMSDAHYDKLLEDRKNHLLETNARPNSHNEDMQKLLKRHEKLDELNEQCKDVEHHTDELQQNIEKLSKKKEKKGWFKKRKKGKDVVIEETASNVHVDRKSNEYQDVGTLPKNESDTNEKQESSAPEIYLDVVPDKLSQGGIVETERYDDENDGMEQLVYRGPTSSSKSEKTLLLDPDSDKKGRRCCRCTIS